MIPSLFGWRTVLALIAIGIVTGTIFYSQYLARKIIKEERQKVEQWVEASKAIGTTSDMDLTLPNLIRNEQTNIPIIETNEKDSIVSFINLDSSKAANDPLYLDKKLNEFRSANKPFVLVLNQNPFIYNKYYYGNTRLLTEVRYFPLVQLFIVALFIIITIVSITSRHQSTQNQVWVGMAKETAHQLGTPISSLQGWVEMLKDNPANDAITGELQKDIDRLNLVSDRFGKIGSTPRLEETNLVDQIKHMVEYIRKRATGKVRFTIEANEKQQIVANISAPLFDWVIENLLKNALDAMEGKGEISIHLQENSKETYIDVRDTGKGISTANLRRIFKPGFTTKKRGWGLGLSLCKRIIEQYHQGQLFVKNSEPGKGTTFRIVLKKKN
ncbi:MAG: HAMP domain-containing sensor histidine kinase [Chitinophagaceae bacterium]